jgi:hypothetical protein
MNLKKLKRAFLILVALHSLFVGLGLLLMPVSWFSFFDFNLTTRFFAAQGGAFHIVLVPAYLFAARIWVKEEGPWIRFVIFVKTFAAIFLLAFTLIKGYNLVILLSGVGDGLMAVIILWFFLKGKEDAKP